MRFVVTRLGSDPLGLRETLERFANEQRLPARTTPEQAAEILFGQFKRTGAQAMEMLEMRADYETATSQPRGSS